MELINPRNSVIIFLSQMTFPTQIPDCDSHNPALLNFFFSSDMAFAPLRNSDHVVVSVSIDFLVDFLSNSQLNVPFHCLAYDYFPADWDGLCDNSRDVPWGRISLKTVLLLLLVNFVGGFRLKLMYISLTVSITLSHTHLHGFQQLLLQPYDRS